MNQNPKSFSPLGAARWVIAPVTLAILAACGGSDDDGPTPPPVVKRVQTGQVAVGALVPGANVTITCAVGGGQGLAVAQAEGVYELEYTADAMRPCIAQALIPNGGGRMYSVIAGGDPSPNRINVTPLTDSLVSYLLGQTNKGQDVNPTELVRQTSELFTQLINSRASFEVSKNNFQSYISGNTGINLSGFDFLASNIVVGQPSDNALEALRNVEVLSNPEIPDSPLVPFLNADGTVSAAGRNTVNFDAPPVTAGDIIGCQVAGNSCGGAAGREIVITGGSGT